MSKNILKEKVLLVGGAGFIGFNYINLYHQKYELHVIDNYDKLIHGDCSEIKQEIIKNLVASQLISDFCSEESLRFTNELSPDYIVLLVSQTGTSDSHNREKYYINENIQKFSTFLNTLKIKPEKLVLPSSRAVYGNGFSKLENGAIVSNGIRSRKDLESGFFKYYWEKNHNGVYLPHDTELPSNPTSIYGVTKLAQEGLCHSVLPAMDIDYNILRLQNVIGPYQSPLNPYTGLMCWFIDAALKNETISVFENGEIWRDFIDVRDVCKAITTGFTNKIQISDIGSGYPTNLKDFAANIVSIVNSNSKINKVNNFRLGDVRWATSNEKSPYTQYKVNDSIRDYLESTKYLK